MKHAKLAIIGAGAVGSTTAYALMWKNVATEILLIDIDEKRCKGEILDLSDALPFCYASKIQRGTTKEAGQADIVIITAGVRQKPGQPRSDLIAENQKIIKSIINDMKPINPNTIIIMVTNPVDILTYYAQQITDLPKNQIFGSGTFLDSQRLRGILSKKLNIAEQSIQAYVLGEHGDSQFVAWSNMNIAGIPLLDFPIFSSKDLDVMADETKNRVYEIIACKEATFYGIAACVTDICECIIFNQKRIIPLSCFIEKYNVCLSMPAVLGEKGIEQILSIRLSQKEQDLLEKSVKKLKGVIKDLQ
ncbi:L-lactate dehydrogenase [Candidatus Dependentiae bacterium]|nr:MAG: L-lactate dehydrogenase [Candidatus Dependentiae bacterium]